MAFQGLAYCTNTISSPACIQKAVQTSLSFLLLLAIVVPTVIRMKYERQVNLYILIKGLMCLSLVFNILYCILHKIEEFYMLQSLFFNCYFPILVYKFALKLIQKDISLERLHLRINICLACYIIIVFIVFIYRNIRPNFTCQEIPFLVMNILSVSLSVWLVLFGIKHHKSQNQIIIMKSAVINHNRSVSNPLPQMWKCIVINILSNAAALFRTVYYLATPQMNCHFVQNETEEQVINFILLILTFYMGMIATLVFFHQKNKSTSMWRVLMPIIKTSLRKNSEDGKVQLIEATNFQKKSITGLK